MQAPLPSRVLRAHNTLTELDFQFPPRQYSFPSLLPSEWTRAGFLFPWKPQVYTFSIAISDAVSDQQCDRS